jgi:hypothetical protein
MKDFYTTAMDEAARIAAINGDKFTESGKLGFLYKLKY